MVQRPSALRGEHLLNSRRDSGAAAGLPYAPRRMRLQGQVLRILLEQVAETLLLPVRTVRLMMLTRHTACTCCARNRPSSSSLSLTKACMSSTPRAHLSLDDLEERVEQQVVVSPLDVQVLRRHDPGASDYSTRVFCGIAFQFIKRLDRSAVKDPGAT